MGALLSPSQKAMVWLLQPSTKPAPPLSSLPVHHRTEDVGRGKAGLLSYWAEALLAVQPAFLAQSSGHRESLPYSSSVQDLEPCAGVALGRAWRIAHAPSLCQVPS